MPHACLPWSLGAFEGTLAELDESSNVTLSIFHTGSDDAGGVSDPLPKSNLFKGRPNFYELLVSKRTDGVVGVYVDNDTATTAATAATALSAQPRTAAIAHAAATPLRTTAADSTTDTNETPITEHLRYSCGPKSMMKAVALTVARRAPSPKFLLHEETFEL